MKRFFAILAAFVIALSAHAAEKDQKLQKALELAKSGKAASAAKLLVPEKGKEPVGQRLLAYVNILAENHIMQIGFKSFSLRDLKKGEKIEDARASGGAEEFFEEDLEAKVVAALQAAPENPHVNMAAGKYIYDAIECACATFERLRAEPEEALRYYLKAYEGGVFDFQSLYRLGFLYQLKGGEENVAKALSFYQKAYEINPKYVPLRYNLGVIYAMTGFADKAREHALAALDGYGDEERDGGTRYLMARIEEISGNEKEAGKFYLGALEKSPYDPDYLSDYAAFLRKKGDFASYEKVVVEAVSRDFSDPDIFSAYVRLVSRMGAAPTDVAILSTLSKAKFADPLAEGTALFNLGQLAEVTGDRTTAKESYRRALELLSGREGVNPKLLESLKTMLSRQGQ